MARGRHFGLKSNGLPGHPAAGARSQALPLRAKLDWPRHWLRRPWLGGNRG
jgi:hypothetical protein